jgi:hypothetical protein
VLAAVIGGEAIARRTGIYWATKCYAGRMSRLGSIYKVRDLVPVNMVKQRKEDEGYRHLADIDVSVQGHDANALAAPSLLRRGASVWRSGIARRECGVRLA